LPWTASASAGSNAEASRQEIADYLSDGSDHTRNIIGAYMWVVGALAFLWFVTRLRSVLRRPKMASCRTWFLVPG
jgi:hypothetical protein